MFFCVYIHVFNLKNGTYMAYRKHKFFGVINMKRIWKNSCIKWVILAETVGLLAGIFTRGGMADYNSVASKPAFVPPEWVFPVVWTILYALMGKGMCLVVRTESFMYKQRSINLFVTQLIVNFFWPFFFFNVGAYGFSLVWLVLLWGLVLWMVIVFSKTSTKAALLQLPYLIWLTFAAYLNATVWIQNH